MPTDAYYNSFNMVWGAMNVWLFVLGAKIYISYPFNISHSAFWKQICPTKFIMTTAVTGSIASTTQATVFSMWGTGWSNSLCL
jgi:hypothetical protein